MHASIYRYRISSDMACSTTLVQEGRSAAHLLHVQSPGQWARAPMHPVGVTTRATPPHAARPSHTPHLPTHPPCRLQHVQPPCSGCQRHRPVDLPQQIWGYSPQGEVAVKQDASLLGAPHIVCALLKRADTQSVAQSEQGGDTTALPWKTRFA